MVRQASDPGVSQTNPVASMRFEALLVRLTQLKTVPANRRPLT